MATISVSVKMETGSGLGLFVKADDNNVLHFDGSDIQNITLNAGNYIATVGGDEPSAATVIIAFIENGSTLAQQSYSSPTFFGFIPFTVI